MVGGPAGIEEAEPVDVGHREPGEPLGVELSGPVGTGVGGGEVAESGEIPTEPVDGQMSGRDDELVEVLGDDATVVDGEGVEVLERYLATVERLSRPSELRAGLGVTFGLAGLRPRLACDRRDPVGNVTPTVTPTVSPTVATLTLTGSSLQLPQPLHSPGAEPVELGLARPDLPQQPLDPPPIEHGNIGLRHHPPRRHRHDMVVGKIEELQHTNSVSNVRSPEECLSGVPNRFARNT